METLKSPPEQKVFLENVSWQTYERLLAEREERRKPRFFYDQGVLEIVSPSTEHEAVSRTVALLVQLLTAELGIDLFSAGSTTFRREDLERGFEPDECFYFSENAGHARNVGDIDLSTDPPPDLVVEIDVTSPSLNKLPVYARLGISEVWRFSSGQAEILLLNANGDYEASSTLTSRVLPSLTGEALKTLVEDGLRLNHPEWVQRVRRWAHESQ